MALDDTASLEKGTPDLFPNSGQQSVDSDDAATSSLVYTAEEEQRVLRKGDFSLSGLGRRTRPLTVFSAAQLTGLSCPA